MTVDRQRRVNALAPTLMAQVIGWARRVGWPVLAQLDASVLHMNALIWSTAAPCVSALERQISALHIENLPFRFVASQTTDRQSRRAPPAQAKARQRRHRQPRAPQISPASGLDGSAYIRLPMRPAR